MLRMKHLQNLLSEELKNSPSYFRNILLVTPEGGILAYGERPSHTPAPNLTIDLNDSHKEVYGVPESNHERTQTLAAVLVNLYYYFATLIKDVSTYIIDYERGTACVGEIYLADCILCIWADENSPTGYLLSKHQDLSHILCNFIVNETKNSSVNSIQNT